MKIGLYDPYMPILGGAERYILAIANCLKTNNQIILYCDDSELLNKAQEKFGLDTSFIETKKWEKDRNKRNILLKELDLFFYVTDGSIFYSPVKRNVLIIQTPLHIPRKSFANLIKLFSWGTLICYSQFMAEIIHKNLGKTAQILFVPIQATPAPTAAKTQMIISVGRFFPNLHNKKQHQMVTAFKELINDGVSEVELCLVGSVDPGGEVYFQYVKDLAVNYPVRFVTSASYQQLIELYQKAKVYWHAAGFGEDLENQPEKAEHFGVSTIEAMSYGCVPVVFAGGGQKEIVKNGLNGFYWGTLPQLKDHTTELLTDKVMQATLAQAAWKDAQQYTYETFDRRLYEILKFS